MRLVASRDGRENSVIIHQDVNLYSTLLKKNDTVTHYINGDRCIWIQMVKGSILLNNQALSVGDGAAITKETNLIMECNNFQSEFLLFDMANST